jgi:hypothetical protein
VNRYQQASDGPSVAIFMLLGIWVFGSTAMMVAASFYGAGFLMSRSDLMTVITLGLLPPYTLMMAAYDGSVFGLVFASLLMPAAHLRFEKHRWVLPVALRRWLMRGYEQS